MSESSRERERKFHGAKVPGNESSREQIGQAPNRTFTPRSKLARERKGCDSTLLPALDSSYTAYSLRRYFV